MTLACWASSGQAAQGCILLEQQLRACMDSRVCGTEWLIANPWLIFDPEIRRSGEERNQCSSWSILPENKRAYEEKEVMSPISYVWEASAMLMHEETQNMDRLA